MQVGLVFLTDIVVFLKSDVNRTGQVRRVLRLLYEAEVTLRQKKFRFFAATKHYLVHVILLGCLELAQPPTDAAAKLKQPTEQTELCSFTGLFNVFTRFGPNLAHRPDLIRKKPRNN